VKAAAHFPSFVNPFSQIITKKYWNDFQFQPLPCHSYFNDIGDFPPSMDGFMNLLEDGR